ncbi:MAG: metallophosphoesterase [Thermoleophilia bacterium]
MLAGGAFAGAAYMLYEAQWLRRVDRRLLVPEVAADLDGLTIVQLSDLHAGFGPSLNVRALRKAVDLTLAARPDLVVVTGDFAGGPFSQSAWQRQLRRLMAPLGVLGVMGNHDHGDSKAPFVSAMDPELVTGCGVRLLMNEVVTLRRGGAVVQVGGVDDSSGGYDDLAAVEASLDRRPEVLRLLLTHHAEVALRAAPGDFHLALAGDTHGGQIRIPLPGGPVPLSDLGARFVEGYHEVDGRRIYVTRGVGTSLLPFRAFCRPEIVVLHVVAGPK